MAAILMCAFMLFSVMGISASAASEPDGNYTATLGSAHAQAAVDGYAVLATVSGDQLLTLDYQPIERTEYGITLEGYVTGVTVTYEVDDVTYTLPIDSQSYAGVGDWDNYDGYTTFDVTSVSSITNIEFAVSFEVALYWGVIPFGTHQLNSTSLNFS